MKALRIDIEGTDGAGKTTGLKYLITQLEKRGQTVLETREVGSPLIPICVKLRELILLPESNMSGESMELVFAAMRLLNQDYYKTVENNYDFIISDRGWLSHLAYTDHNVNEQFTKKLYTNFIAEMTELPDIIIYFDVNAEIALKRRAQRGTDTDTIEMKGIHFQEKVGLSFQKYIAQLPSNIDIFYINANQDIEGVQKQLDVIINKLSATIKEPR